MLFLSLALAAPPVAVDVTGMAPQIEIIRRDVVERGWQITCEGRSGEEQVVRLAFPPGTSDEAIQSYFDPQAPLGSSSRFYGPDETPPERCDREPATTTSSDPRSVLAIGTRDSLEHLASIAHACGLERASIRQRGTEDVPPGITGVVGDWTLDAGEDVTPRNGPMICLLQMQLRASESR